jgi:16S rRNA processing protein RimM
VATPEDLVIVGRVRRPHGVRGEVLIEVLTDEPDAVYASGRRVFGGTVDGDAG